MEFIKLHMNSCEMQFDNFYKISFSAVTNNDILTRLDAAVSDNVIVTITDPQKRNITDKFVTDENTIIPVSRLSQLIYIVSRLM